MSDVVYTPPPEFYAKVEDTPEFIKLKEKQDHIHNLAVTSIGTGAASIVCQAIAVAPIKQAIGFVGEVFPVAGGVAACVSIVSFCMLMYNAIT